MDPAKDVAALLIAAGPLAGVALVRPPAASPNLFVGPMRPPSPTGAPAAARIPARAVFVLETGGPAPQPYLDGRGVSFRRKNVQVLVRSEQADHSGGEALAKAILPVIHTHAPAGYVGALALDEPAYIGTDEQGCHLWSTNFHLWWEG
jgi:hypothetical protein